MERTAQEPLNQKSVIHNVVTILELCERLVNISQEEETEPKQHGHSTRCVCCFDTTLYSKKTRLSLA